MEESSNSKNGKNNYCYVNTRISVANDGGIIKKGPWKPEEDQVLLDHVRKHGNCDWSSIRSKDLLQRTGKSCRLRWVNKLRPDLKSGCKFTAEEERMVIELQSQLGNKWATIAKHLTGRTDNDVKNFWSSRQKRLARILSSESPQPLKKHKSSSSTITTTTTGTSSTNPFLFIEVPNSSFTKGETPSKAQSSSSSSQTDVISDTMQMITACPDAPNQEYPTSEPNNNNNIILEPIPLNTYLPTNEFQLDEIPFPPLQTYLPLPQETQELLDRLAPEFLQPFGYTDEPILFDDMRSPSGVKSVTPDSYFDDIPSDMFDQIEPLPSPSSW